MNQSVKWGHRKVNGPLDGLHLIPDLIFPVQKIRGTSLPWCCANWTQNIWIINSPQMSDLNPRWFRRKRTIFSEFLRWTPRSLNAKIRIIKKTNPDYIITRKRVGRDRHGSQLRVFKLIVAIRIWSIGTSLGSCQGSILTFSYFLLEIV